MRISDWSSDVCSSDLENGNFFIINQTTGEPGSPWAYAPPGFGNLLLGKNGIETKADSAYFKVAKDYTPTSPWSFNATYTYTKAVENRFFSETFAFDFPDRSEEHTSELQSLMRISYAVFCLKKKKTK